MKINESVFTPRFCTVTIKEIFSNRLDAAQAGYTEPTHYHKDGWCVVGKSLDLYHMEFAAYAE